MAWRYGFHPARGHWRDLRRRFRWPSHAHERMHGPANVWPMIGHGSAQGQDRVATPRSICGALSWALMTRTHSFQTGGKVVACPSHRREEAPLTTPCPAAAARPCGSWTTCCPPTTMARHWRATRRRCRCRRRRQFRYQAQGSHCSRGRKNNSSSSRRRSSRNDSNFSIGRLPRPRCPAPLPRRRRAHP